MFFHETSNLKHKWNHIFIIVFIDIDDLIEDDQHEEMLNLLMTHPEDLNLLCNSYSHSPLLHRACYYNRMNIVHNMIKYGLDVHAVDDDNWNIIHNCCFFNSHDVLKSIVQYCTVQDINTHVSGYAPVVSASWNGNIKCLQLIIQHVDNVEDINKAIRLVCLFTDDKKNEKDIVKILQNKRK